MQSSWPRVTDQTIVLQSFQYDGHSGLIVGGGSPAATLWAVYELGYRYGVRYLLRGDVFPEDPLALKLDGFAVVTTPTLRTRAWQMIGDSPVGSESWPLLDQKRLLAQLAKMKFNRIVLSIEPWHPFVQYECRGVKKRTAVLWRGETLPIDRSGPGRTALLGSDELTNSSFVEANGFAEMTAAGVAYVRGMIEEAQRWGMSVTLSISPMEFPPEFAPLLAGSTPPQGRTALPWGPSSTPQTITSSKSSSGQKSVRIWQRILR